ncbi:MarR family winged helix-turn-helix transcriptional regulator [Kineococcus rubinsiae]|uniref:MarR family winged helix-turn-helix transcriptional regulator n=1 Tax=Kineococcus rubinsiae TaxID=2609562 RepID=UPI001431C9EC|nr:MarR family transcriptional regulator [Kineococcus rubinsiae]NIZ90790.1 MarR family transcriptional regulator [Kineococcus rubinsiae]
MSPDGSAPPPLTPEEELTWRTLMRLMVALPRAIDEDLLRRSGLGLTRYVVLMRLSEAPAHTLRMSDLAEAASISPSRMTRVAQSMAQDGLVVRNPDPSDARAALLTLTDEGRERLEEAWPAHLAGVRALVMDHLGAEDLPRVRRFTDLLLRAVEGSAPEGP